MTWQFNPKPMQPTLSPGGIIWFESRGGEEEDPNPIGKIQSCLSRIGSDWRLHRIQIASNTTVYFSLLSDQCTAQPNPRYNPTHIASLPTRIRAVLSLPSPSLTQLVFHSSSLLFSPLFSPSLVLVSSFNRPHHFPLLWFCLIWLKVIPVEARVWRAHSSARLSKLFGSCSVRTGKFVSDLYDLSILVVLTWKRRQACGCSLFRCESFSMRILIISYFLYPYLFRCPNASNCYTFYSVSVVSDYLIGKHINTKF